MTRRRLHAPLVGLLLIVAVARIASAAGPNPVTVVVPNSLASVEGTDNNGFPFWPLGANPPSMRYQQVYAASQFSSLNSAGESITHIAFRADATSPVFAAAVSSLQINLSTTAATPDSLSTTFANNVGANDKIVFGPAPFLFSSALGPMPGPKPFDVVVPLTSPFLYKPSAGNLLLDIRSVGGNTAISLDAQDTTGDSIGRQYSSVVNGNLNSLTSNTLRPSLGLVTRFTTIVPEPIAAQLAVVGISLATCLARRREERRQRMSQRRSCFEACRR